MRADETMCYTIFPDSQIIIRENGRPAATHGGHPAIPFQNGDTGCAVWMSRRPDVPLCAFIVHYK